MRFFPFFVINNRVAYRDELHLNKCAAAFGSHTADMMRSALKTTGVRNLIYIPHSTHQFLLQFLTFYVWVERRAHCLELRDSYGICTCDGYWLFHSFLAHSYLSSALIHTLKVITVDLITFSSFFHCYLLEVKITKMTQLADYNLGERER